MHVSSLAPRPRAPRSHMHVYLEQVHCFIEQPERPFGQAIGHVTTEQHQGSIHPPRGPSPCPHSSLTHALRSIGFTLVLRNQTSGLVPVPVSLSVGPSDCSHPVTTESCAPCPLPSPLDTTLSTALTPIHLVCQRLQYKKHRPRW